MICRASVGTIAPPLGCQLDTTSGFSGECVSTGQALRCDDSETDHRVDAVTCRQLGVRSILAVPIFFGRDIVGLLEVFATQAFAFDDGHFAAVKRLAQAAIATPAAATIQPPTLLVEYQPAYQIFWRNLIDTCRAPRTASATFASTAPFWTDVFVPSPIPWNRFLQSMLLHAVLLVILGSVIEFSFFETHSVQLVPFNQADVIYYTPSEYLRAASSARATPQLPHRQSQARQPTLIVSRERELRTLAAPDVRLKQEVQFLHIVALNSVIPAIPISAIARSPLTAPLSVAAPVAPSPDIHRTIDRRIVTGFGAQGVVGPPPELSRISRSPTFASPTGVVGPPPSIRSLAGQPAIISLGRIEPVGPAPQMSLPVSGTPSGLLQATLGGAVVAAVPPPPSLDGWGNSRHPFADSASAARWQVQPPAAVIERASVVARMTSPVPPGPMSSPAPLETNLSTLADSKELNVNFIGLALALPSSSYFPSHEVFIAENRLSRSQSRLIKLVYEFLPYQTRLSDYGPDYPAIDKLRVTRDPSCDETLVQVLSSANTPSWPHPERLPQAFKNSAAQARTLECYRTTADDYRRVRTHHP